LHQVAVSLAVIDNFMVDTRHPLDATRYTMYPHDVKGGMGFKGDLVGRILTGPTGKARVEAEISPGLFLGSPGGIRRDQEMLAMGGAAARAARTSLNNRIVMEPLPQAPTPDGPDVPGIVVAGVLGRHNR